MTPGYEQLTPDQIMQLGYLAMYIATIIVIGWCFRSVMNYLTARVIKFNIEQQVIKEIVDKVTIKKSLFQQIKTIWAKRKIDKTDPFIKQYGFSPIEKIKE